ncbi:MAG: hypothetical protein O2820_14535 [Planctomycetota bacterium]|nr:hypothetical protein [Planctomycetota bacterium]MDA1250431.1 hypothetical protein [Planctomycetota bacterium]
MKPGTVRVARSRVLARLRSEFGDLVERIVPWRLASVYLRGFSVVSL